jgi:hypothetical protein
MPSCLALAPDQTPRGDATRLVAANWVMIDRLAHRLDEAGEMSGEEIDAIRSKGEPRRARQLRSLSGSTRAMS